MYVAGIATVGLGVSDFVHRTIVSFVSVVSVDSVVSGMDSKNHSSGICCTGMAIAYGRQCTMGKAYTLLSALQLPLNRFISFRVIASFFAHPPLPVYMYIAASLLQAYIERSISNRHRNFLGAVAIGLNISPTDYYSAYL